MKNSQIEDLFFDFSKLIFLIPVIVVSLALFLKYYQSPRVADQTQRVLVTPTVTAKIDNQILGKLPLKSGSGSAGLNLIGPYVCQYNQNGLKSQAYIKNKQISATINQSGKQEKLVIKGDCLYQWTVGSYSGEKTCGVSTYLSMLEMLSQSNLIDMGSLMKMLGQFAPLAGTQEANMAEILKSCQKQPVEDSRFVIPGNILFKNQSQE